MDEQDHVFDAYLVKVHVMHPTTNHILEIERMGRAIEKLEEKLKQQCGGV